MDELIMLTSAYVLFVGLIVGEAAFSYGLGRGYYRFGEAACNVAHGIVYQTVDVFTKLWVMVPFLWLSQHAPAQLPVDQWWAWVLGLIAYDFCIYWAHRHGHEIGFLWAIHAVHHAAEDYNLAAALRQPAFQGILGWIWRLPLALFMPVEMFVGLVVFDFLYQFIQHTRFVGKLGPLEWVLNTPSHHRVHHGVQEEYLDKNYGGILIIWDRLFGTFQEELHEPTYGVTKPLRSLNPFWGNLHFFAELVEATRRAKGMNKVWLWFAGPGELERLAPGATVQVEHAVQDADLKPTQGVFAAVGTAIAIVSLTALILMEAELGLAGEIGLTAAVLTCLLGTAWVLERARLSAPSAG
ncbi:MAG: sterol desaturase family protein [Proteobacteria bacterium]|nr:sterol desaturase family protein [Pseudomonadota bacterium]